ncbi:MAG: phosphoglycerate kinase [Candidatus Magasanikbacteria bacterium]
MNTKSILKVKSLTGKRILLRVDFNVTMKGKKVLDDARLLASIPTIEYLIKQKAKVILLSHLGRPEGVDSSLSLVPVAKRLETLLKKNINILDINILKKYVKDIEKYFEYASKEIGKMKNGQIFMLENVRFLSGESKNDELVSKQLASLGDVFVLDGFAVAHRASSSVVGISKYLPTYSGLLLEKEIIGLSRVMKEPKHPFILVMGGIKMETKLPVIKNLVGKVDNVLIGGGIASTCFKSMGYDVGDSLVDNDYIDEARKISIHKKIIKPIDVVVGIKDGKIYRVVRIENKPHTICKKGEAIFDVGPGTVRLYSTYIKKAETLVWNGNMGYAEQKPYDMATISIARLVASRSKGKAYGVIGGGETLQAMSATGMSEYVDLISTGGGAMLEFLSGKKLPGVAVVAK